jgi:serine/threonine-protein kinase
MSDEAKQSFDRYTIDGVIGEGGMGRVYRAYDPKLRRHVALKVLRTDASLGDESARRLLREARAAATLNHPNVVAIFDVCESGDEPFVVMELVEGKPLSSLVAEKSVPLERKLRWLTDITRALAAAHDQNIVHRDVKPGNVLVTENDTVKVLDFGLARPIEIAEAGVGEEITQPGQVLGTPSYMAPEQIGGGAIDGRADQFAWGVLAYRVLVGESPWKTAQQHVLAAVLTQDVEPFASRVPGLSREVEGIILRALKKSPDDRFASTHDLVRAMQRATTRSQDDDDEPPPSSVKKEEPMRWRAVSAVALVIVVGFALAHFAGKRSSPSTVASAQATSSSSSSSGAPITMTDLPPPETASADARAAFRQGMQAMRDGDLGAGIEAFKRACSADPGLAAAHLRLGIETLFDDPTEARAHFRSALQQRGALSPHDQVLLDAAIPHVLDDVSNEAEYEKRLVAATERFPNDAELAMYLARTRIGYASLPDQMAILDRGLALDPKFGMLFAAKSELQMYAGDFDGVRKTTRACLEGVPSSVFCLAEQSAVESELGECPAYGADARRLATTTGTGFFQRGLASVLWLEGRPREAVHAAFERAWSAMAEKRRAFSQQEDEILLDEASGDFTAAEKHAKEYQRIAASSDVRGDHAHAAQMLIDVLREVGEDAAASRVASEYLARKDAWVRDPRSEDLSIAHDPTPWMASVAMTHDRFVSMRDEWVRDWSARVLPAWRAFVWGHAYASPATTEADAVDAIAALPRFGEIHGWAPRTSLVVDVGRMYVLARDAEKAVPILTHVARICASLDVPLDYVRGHYWLGRARELTGDKHGACEAYGVVVSRWGKSRSVTARAAADRRRALECP